MAMTPVAILSCVLLLGIASVAAFSTPSSLISFSRSTTPSSVLFLSSETASTSATSESDKIAKQLLCRAAETKQENPNDVLNALSSLEKNCKAKFREDPAAFSKDILDNISGEWRLVFTTGTKERQQKTGGRVNYFPVKAIQKFDTSTEPKFIENGIYLPLDIPLVRFTGDFDFDQRKRKLEFDFDNIEIFGLINIKLGRKDVAKIGASTGLGSANNEKLADAKRRAFFDWISADDDIATARGGGGGLALWKRVVEGVGPGYGEGPV